MQKFYYAFFSFILFYFTLCIYATKEKRVIFFGDSITQAGAAPGGFIPRIDSMCKLENKSDQFEFIGSGISGNKVYDLYLRLDDDVLARNPDVVVVFIGVNDVWHKVTSGTGTDADKFEKFYDALVRKLKEKISKLSFVRLR